VIHLGTANTHHQYEMTSVPLASTSEEKDLGVVIDEDLKFQLHISQVVKKASQMLAIIRVIFTCLETTLPRLFSTMVRPHLDYRNVMWQPRLRRDKMEVEKVSNIAGEVVICCRFIRF